MKGTLFTTTTCPKCPAFKQYVEENVSFPVEVLSEQNPDFATKISEFGVSAAPTLVVQNHGDELLRTSDISELESFLQHSG